MSFSEIKKKIQNKFPFEEISENVLVMGKVLADVKTKDLFGQGGKKVRFKAKLVFDVGKQQVKYSERLMQSESNMGGLRIFSLFSRTKGKLIDTKKKESLSGVDQKGKAKKLYSYDFDPRTIKDSIKKIVEASGWKFKLSLF